ncbi:MAG: ARPP-1 family domain-containing protein [Saprospiraceae bacterium]
MKNFALLLVLFISLFFSCNETSPTSETTATNQPSRSESVAGLTLDLQANPEWSFQNLRLYPILAEPEMLKTNALPTLKTLADAMETAGFRVTERKQFGREQSAWFNALTVQNKTHDTIFLMSGDVVTGGNQDRVIAYDDVVLPGSLKNIEVFCVEAGRSTYYDPAAPESEKRVAAFKGYYNVASPEVRKAVYSGKQEGVWSAVSKVTQANQAASSTQTYAALETENDKKEQREACLRFFEGKFTNLPNAVGVVAVCNGKVVGIDIFGQPDLFRRQFKALLHGFAAESGAAGKEQSNAPELAEKAFRQVAREAAQSSKGSQNVGKYTLGDSWVHLHSK